MADAVARIRHQQEASDTGRCLSADEENRLLAAITDRPKRGWLCHGNPSGYPNTAPRCAAKGPTGKVFGA